MLARAPPPPPSSVAAVRQLRPVLFPSPVSLVSFWPSDRSGPLASTEVVVVVVVARRRRLSAAARVWTFVQGSLVLRLLGGRAVRKSRTKGEGRHAAAAAAAAAATASRNAQVAGSPQRVAGRGRGPGPIRQPRRGGGQCRKSRLGKRKQKKDEKEEKTQHAERGAREKDGRGPETASRGEREEKPRRMGQKGRIGACKTWDGAAERGTADVGVGNGLEIENATCPRSRAWCVPGHTF